VLATLGEVLRRLQRELGTRQDLLRDAASAMHVLFARAAHWRLEERRRCSSGCGGRCFGAGGGWGGLWGGRGGRGWRSWMSCAAQFVPLCVAADFGARGKVFEVFTASVSGSGGQSLWPPQDEAADVGGEIGAGGEGGWAVRQWWKCSR
jgi:hypothetical protein